MAPNMVDVRRLTKKALWFSFATLPTFWSIFFVAHYVPEWWISVPWGIMAGAATIIFGVLSISTWIERFYRVERMNP